MLAAHWPALADANLVTAEPSVCYRGTEQHSNDPVYFEIFQWLPGGANKAHEVAAVMNVWNAMEPLCEQRGDKPSMEFPHVQTLDLRQKDH